MKKLIFLYILTFGFFSISLSQNYGWTDISANMPEEANLNDVHVIGEEVWITGGHDKVYYSPNGGETFQIQQLPENSGITSSVVMKNNLEGYVVTRSGDILKTENGGTIWTTLYEPGGVINSVHFPPNSDTGYTCGVNGTVWMFDDTSITNISPSGVSTNLQSICFPEDNSDGKVCGETTIRRYLNATWVNPQFYDSSLAYFSMFFIDNLTGWAVGIMGAIVRTTDGIYWTRETSNTTQTLNDIFFINALEGWATGTEVLLHTVDGGVTWTQEIANQTAGKELTAIFFTDANNGYVVGTFTVLKYGEVLGIEDETQGFDFQVFPNPVKDKLQIKCANLKIDSGKIEIFSIDGKIILNNELQKGNETVEIGISGLENGMYLCKITIDHKTSTKKIVIE